MNSMNSSYVQLKKEQLKPARNLLGAFQRSDAAFLELDEAQIEIQVVNFLVMVKPC